MRNRIPHGAGLFIVPAETKLKITLTFDGPFAEQLREWAEQAAARWEGHPSHRREICAEQRRLAILLLCEAIGACAADKGLPILDPAVNGLGAPRLEVTAGRPRRHEFVKMADVLRSSTVVFQPRHRN